jgi:hypothetical protein
MIDVIEILQHWARGPPEDGGGGQISEWTEDDPQVRAHARHEHGDHGPSAAAR